MPYCPECGTEVAAEASFCQACGHSLETETGDAPEEPESKPEPQSDGEATPERQIEGFDVRHAGAATGFALLPAFGAYMLVSFGAYDPIPPVFLVVLPIFGYLLYRRASTKAMASGMFFWLAVESFLSPLAALFYTSSYTAAETETAAEQAGAAIGGGVVIVMTFIIGLSIGLVFYIISSRLEPDEA